MKHSFMLLLVTLMCILLCCAGCDNTDADSEKNHVTYNRFVEVSAKDICPEYTLGIESHQNDNNYYRYLVDRVSRRVYIEIREIGKHSSGIVWIECLDKDGNHMVYTGELEEK